MADDGWRDLDKDLRRLAVHDVNLAKQLYKMGWRKTTEGKRVTTTVHKDGYFLPTKDTTTTNPRHRKDTTTS